MRPKKLPVLVLFALVLLLAVPASAQRIHLDLEGSNSFIESLKDANSPFGVPPNCSNWHELSPNYCVIHHQDDYFDTDNNQCLSPCDGIKLNGQWYHITWVGWTVFCEDGSWTLEPADVNPTDPTINSWFEVRPNYGEVHQLRGWTRADGTAVDYTLRKEDDGHAAIPEPKVGDILDFGADTTTTQPCEVARVSVDIIVEPRG